MTIQIAGFELIGSDLYDGEEIEVIECDFRYLFKKIDKFSLLNLFLITQDREVHSHYNNKKE